MKAIRTIAAFTLFASLFALTGCGASSKNGNNPQSPGAPIDPSGNWNLTYTDASNNKLSMSALFSQVGSVVSAAQVFAINPPPFNCVPFAATFANGTVQNVSDFSGDFQSQFGNIHFDSTLNPQGSHADGTYSLTGTCWGVAATGTFTADEVPNMTGSWSGTLNCTANCLTGSTSGAVSMTLTQDNSTGAVTGTYTVTGLPTFSSGTVQGDQFSVLSGANWQDNMTDNDGNKFVISGGPQGNPTDPPGLGLDGSFNGIIVPFPSNTTSTPVYSLIMSH